MSDKHNESHLVMPGDIFVSKYDNSLHYIIVDELPDGGLLAMCAHGPHGFRELALCHEWHSERHWEIWIYFKL